VLGKTRSTLLAATSLIILTAALCVLSTLMGWVFDRRRDFAIMKALVRPRACSMGFSLPKQRSWAPGCSDWFCCRHRHCGLDWPG